VTRCTVDTNVPIVANGRLDPSNGARQPSLGCREAAIIRLMALVERGTVVLDEERLILEEYRRHLNPSGQPGVGDLFYQTVLRGTVGLVEYVALPRNESGHFEDFPTCPALAKFDPSDRKFAALGRREGIPVLTATDTDWLNDRVALMANGIQVDLICGCDTARWFEA
jgi:hypothetical protein